MLKEDILVSEEERPTREQGSRHPHSRIWWTLTSGFAVLVVVIGLIALNYVRPMSLVLPKSNATESSTTPTGTPVTDWAGYEQFRMVSQRIGWTVAGQNEVLRTIDGGRTWSNVLPLTNLTKSSMPVTKVQIIASKFYDANRAWVVASPTGGGQSMDVRVFSTTNGGQSWSTTSLFIDAKKGVDPISIDFANSNDGLLLLGINGRTHVAVYRTDDGGRKWVKVSGTKAGSGGNGLPDIGTKVGLRMLSSKVAFVTMVGSIGAKGQRVQPIYRTTDGGRTWRATKINLSTESWDYAGIPTFFSSTDGAFAIVYLRDILHNSNIETSSGAVSVVTYTTKNAGASWKVKGDLSFSLPKKGGFSGPQMDFLSARVGFVSGRNVPFFVTTDGYHRWDTVHTLPASLQSQLPQRAGRVDFVNPSDGFAIGHDGQLYCTTNGGKSWVNLHPVITRKRDAT